MNPLTNLSPDTPVSRRSLLQGFALGGAALATKPIEALGAIAKPQAQEDSYQGPKASDFFPKGEERTKYRDNVQEASKLINDPKFFSGLEMQRTAKGKVVKLSLNNINAIKDKLNESKRKPVTHVFATQIGEDRSSYTLQFVRAGESEQSMVRVRATPVTKDRAMDVFEPGLPAATVTEKDGVTSLKYQVVNIDEIPIRFDPNHPADKNGVLISSPELMKFDVQFSDKFTGSKTQTFRDDVVMTIDAEGKRAKRQFKANAEGRNLDEKGQPREHPLWDLNPTYVVPHRKVETREDGKKQYAEVALLQKGDDKNYYSTNPNADGPRLVGGEIDKKTGALKPSRLKGEPRFNRVERQYQLSNAQDLSNPDKPIESFVIDFK